MTIIEQGSGNVYADLGLTDADEMLVKARLAAKIAEIIKNHRWTPQEAAAVVGMQEPELSNLLRGQFRGVSETEMLECLAKLGNVIEVTHARISG